MTDLQGMTQLFAMLQSMNTKLNSGGPLDRVRHTGNLLHAASVAQDGENRNLAGEKLTEDHVAAKTYVMHASIGEA